MLYTSPHTAPTLPAPVRLPSLPWSHWAVIACFLADLIPTECQEGRDSVLFSIQGRPWPTVDVQRTLLNADN